MSSQSRMQFSPRQIQDKFGEQQCAGFAPAGDQVVIRRLELTGLWALVRRTLNVFGVVCGLVLWVASAQAGQISCAKSGVDFDRSVFSGSFDFVCKTEKTAANAAAGSGAEADVERAFSPAGSVIDGVLMSSQDGKYGNAFLITAHDGGNLGEPQLRNAIESKVRLYGDKAGSVAWEDQHRIGEYDVDFFRLTLHQPASGGGARECMGFVRFVDGVSASHEQRVIGSYCETGARPLDDDKAALVLNAVIVRLDSQ